MDPICPNKPSGRPGLGRLVISAVIAACLLLAPALSAAERMYVIDELIVTIRAEKSNSAKIINRLKSLEAVEVLESDEDWSRVRLADGSEGWVQTKYLTTEEPLGLKADTLAEENSRLKERIEELKAENARYQADNAQLAEQIEREKAELTKLRSEYGRLSAEASDYLSLKQEYDQVKADLAAARQELAELSESADDSLSQQRLKWFIAGAGVLIAGWIVGLLSARRKRSGSRYY